MTENFSVSRCRACGSRVGFEDGMRQDLCECDPWCESCGRQFMGSGRLCQRCIEEMVEREFSEEFLKTLSHKQMTLLLRDISRRFER
jgi:hypothetical protein